MYVTILLTNEVFFSIKKGTNCKTRIVLKRRSILHYYTNGVPQKDKNYATLSKLQLTSCKVAKIWVKWLFQSIEYLDLG